MLRPFVLREAKIHLVKTEKRVAKAKKNFFTIASNCINVKSKRQEWLRSHNMFTKGQKDRII